MERKGIYTFDTFVSAKCIYDLVDKSFVQTPHMKCGVLAPIEIELVLSNCNWAHFI